MKRLITLEEFINENIDNEINESEKAIVGTYKYKGKTYDLWTDDEHNHWIVVNGRKIDINNESKNESIINEAAESLITLLNGESTEIKNLASEIENMLEPKKFKIGIGDYDKIMILIANIAKSK